jgi:hypothetical protein
MVQDENVPEDYKNLLLNANRRGNYLQDSLACMITKINPTRYDIRCMGFANGKWLNIGEDISRSIESARK